MFEVRLTYVKLHTHSFLCKIKKALCWVKELNITRLVCLIHCRICCFLKSLLPRFGDLSTAILQIGITWKSTSY